MLDTDKDYKFLLVLYKFARCQCESILANNAFNIYFGPRYTSFQQRLKTALTIPFGLCNIQPSASFPCCLQKSFFELLLSANAHLYIDCLLLMEEISIFKNVLLAKKNVKPYLEKNMWFTASYYTESLCSIPGTVKGLSLAQKSLAPDVNGSFTIDSSGARFSTIILRLLL